VGEGKPKLLSAATGDSVTLTYTKVAAIAVITQELARFGNPSAEAWVRDELAKAVIARIDTDFIDPAKAVSSYVNPASITNGLTALTSAGTSADNVRTDVQNLLEQYILNNLDPTDLVLIMPNTLAMVLSIMVNTLGQREFPNMTINGGSLLGIPVIASQYAASGASFGNMVIAVKANDVALADDGRVTVDVSGEASLEMVDSSSQDATTGTGASLVSMFQTNSLAVRAEREIHWAKLRSTAVVYMDDVNWGAIGSPY
jgi:HK97 family phage major capsid protein